MIASIEFEFLANIRRVLELGFAIRFEFDSGEFEFQFQNLNSANYTLIFKIQIRRILANTNSNSNWANFSPPLGGNSPRFSTSKLRIEKPRKLHVRLEQDFLSRVSKSWSGRSRRRVGPFRQRSRCGQEGFFHVLRQCSTPLITETNMTPVSGADT
jgi:hypothetical protein